MSTKNQTNKTKESTSTDLFTSFTEAVKLEFEGLQRFNEIEEELKTLQTGTPEFKAIRHERMDMIKQVRGSRKTQKQLKLEIANL